MKKLMLLAFCLLIGGQGLFAQNEKEEKKFFLGLSVFPKISWASPSSKNLQSNGVKMGLNVGLTGDYFFAKNYALSVDILHSVGGYKLTADSISKSSVKHGNVGITYKENAFQIPISLKLRTNEIGYWRYFAQFGIAPTFSYRPIRADFDNDKIFNVADDSKNRLVNDDKNDFDFAGVPAGYISDENKRYYLEEDNVSTFRFPLLIGAGAEWNLSGNTSIVMGLRYHFGLGNVMKAQDTRASVSSLALHAGIKF